MCDIVIDVRGNNMEKIGLLIDSTTITREDFNHYPFIKVAQLGVTIDGVDFLEKDLSISDMDHYLKTAKKMTTSQPAPGEFLKLYQEFYDEGYTHILVVTLSEKISGTYQSALIAKTLVDFEIEVSVHSPKVASFGVALGVIKLADEIVSGISFDGLIEKYHSVFENATLLFTLVDLMNVFRGGRLNRVSALLGTVLRIKPIVEMTDGKLNLTRKERTNNACFDYFMSKVEDYNNRFKKISIDVIHMNRADWAEKLKKTIEERFPHITVHLTSYVSPVFFVHLGNQGFGLALIGE